MVIYKGHDALCPQETKDNKEGRAQFIVPLHVRNYRELTREFLSGKIIESESRGCSLWKNHSEI